MLEESVIYQDIFQKGHLSGKQEGRKEEGQNIALLQLETKFGSLSRVVRQQIERLVTEQVEALCKALINFKSKQDLTQWLKQHSKQHR